MRKTKLFSVLLTVLTLIAIATAALPLSACKDEPVTFEISYIAGEGGVVAGLKNQVVEQGGETIAVTAVPLSGWYFECWSDGYAQPIRKDVNVQQSGEFTAIFSLIDAPDAGDNDEGELPESPEAEPQAPEGESA